MVFKDLKYNRYKINRQPQHRKGFVTVLLNLSNDGNFEFVIRQAANRASHIGLKIRGLFLDLDDRMSDDEIDQLSNKMKDQCENCGYAGEVKLDVENQSFHKLIDSYFENSAVVICDSGLTNAEKRWRHYLARTVGCEMVRVEKRRSRNFFNLEKIVGAVTTEKITLPDLMSWVNRDVDLYNPQ